MTQSIRFSRLSDMPVSTTESVAMCYADVFAAPPWNEYMRCSCGKRWGKLEYYQASDSPRCGHSGVLDHDGPEHDIAPYWDVKGLAREFESKMDAGASIWVAIDQPHGGGRNKLVGFCVGQSFQSVDELGRVLEMESLSSDLQRAFLHIGMPILYQDDIGVLPEYRQCGIARELFACRLADFRLINPAGIVVVRTMTKPASVTYNWYVSMGYKVISQYRDDRGRVILGKPISEL